MDPGTLPQRELHAVRLVAGPTVATFTQADDRWRHDVTAADGRVWKSVEDAGGASDDPRWPRSPPFTEVSLVEVGGRPAVLGIGRAGRSHFSLCVTVHPELRDTLVFEVACRIHTAPEWIGSTYGDNGGKAWLIEPLLPLPLPPATVRWSYAFGPHGPRAITLGAVGP